MAITFDPQMVSDLYDLGDMNIKLVLFALESVQSDIGLTEGGHWEGDLDALRAKEEVLRELIKDIWLYHFHS